jgi:PAS domain S-box-containing protein
MTRRTRSYWTRVGWPKVPSHIRSRRRSLDTGTVAVEVCDELRWREREIDAIRGVLSQEELQLLYRRLAHETRYTLEAAHGGTFWHTAFVDGRPVMCQIHLTPDVFEQQVYAVIKPLEPFRPEQAFGAVGTAFLDHTPDVVVLSRAEPSLAPGPTVIYVNASFSRVTGFRAEDIVGKTPRILQGTATSGEARARIREKLERWEQVFEQMINYRQDGSEFLVDLNICPICSPSGWYTYWLSLQREVTQEVEERRRREERNKLEAIGTLASGIAHEINTPAQYVQENLRFVAEGAATLARYAQAASARQEAVDGDDLAYLAQEVPAACAEALDGLDRITRTVAAMRTLTHPGRVEHALVTVAKLMDDAITLTRGFWSPVCELIVDRDREVDRLHCDGHAITQCLVNLIVNAAQAIAAGARAGRPLGRIEVTAMRDGDEMVIAVEDNGPGVPDHIGNQVFDAFFTTKPIGEGTGQGLALAREIVEQRHLGKLLLEPVTHGDTGARFVMRLPAGRAVDELLP